MSSSQTKPLPMLILPRLVSLCMGLALGLSTAAAIANEEDLGSAEHQVTPPENWYQVEVILFTQQGNTGSESPPQNYQLDFPTNWQQLIDPRLADTGVQPPIAEGALLSPDRVKDTGAEPQQWVIPHAQVEDPAISQFQDQGFQDKEFQDGDNDKQMIADARALAAQRLAEAQAIDQQLAMDGDISEYQPRYEQPMLLLSSDYRDLNESALALDRRGYNVVLHNAWRFASEGEAKDPWLLIKAGQRLEDRYQIEGSLRFYKSRFLHFQTNLWLAQFSNEDSQLLELPNWPKVPQPETASSEQSGTFYTHLDNLQPLDIAMDVDLNMESAQGLIATNPDHFADRVDPRLLELATQKLSKPKQYPIAELWTLNRSVRLDEAEVYYLDHPKMGLLVSIKSYQPVLLNPPVTESAEDTDRDSAILASD